MWRLSHLDHSLPSGIFPSFSCSNASYTALNYARTIFFDDDANSDVCLNLFSNRTSTLPNENKDDTALCLQEASRDQSITAYCMFHSPSHIHPNHGHVSVQSMKKEWFEFTSLLLYQAINGNASKAMTCRHRQNTQSHRMRVRLLSSNGKRHSMNVPFREVKFPMKSTLYIIIHISMYSARIWSTWLKDFHFCNFWT